MCAVSSVPGQQVVIGKADVMGAAVRGSVGTAVGGEGGGIGGVGWG